MKVDGNIGWELDKVGAEARELEEMGYSGVFTAETGHDPFLPLAITAQATSRVDIATAITVAFARSPMTLAHVGHDLNAASRGRFVLGPGSHPFTTSSIARRPPTRICPRPPGHRSSRN